MKKAKAKSKEMKFQENLVEKLNTGELSYLDASIYTVLLALVEDNGIDEVFMILHNVANDLNQRDILENKFKDAKNWQWIKK